MTQTHSKSTASPAWGVWRTVLVAAAVVGALAGCSSTSGSARSSDPASPQQGSSGVTVFGDIDVGVTRERTR
ncbi:MAG: hypothetical protein KKB95_14210 [Gammaproteobacteria bacterium]|jgi:hypothetical protein|nr:hypothetical protein [Gammaproteobacteria bacterium]MBU1353021.1 hypothetical protein [Gammaproteobacteria bacterium]MBU1506055.1 hypothetical protein [Gammaproteobacteria bacterium]MBU1817489.1 hypothetical protein [Gammaproteobacteria bacterium]MBU2123552.1 hypothetical protein [Gammaproteobacteria bacterium]